MSTHDLTTDKFKVLSKLRIDGTELTMRTDCKNYKRLKPVPNETIKRFEADMADFPDTDIFVMVIARQDASGRNYSPIVWEAIDKEKPWRYQILINK
jgi:hypothetical protein